MLWFKLINEGISTRMLKAVRVIYNSEKSVIKNDNNFSLSFDVLNGVKQGDPLCIALIHFFVHDFTNNI